MNPELYKVPTGSIGPDSQPIFDVFGGPNATDYIKDPNDPRLSGINIPDLPEGTAPEGFESQFKTPAGDLYNKGAVTTGELPEERLATLKKLEDRMNMTDDYVSQLMSLYTPTDREKSLQEEIDQMRISAELGIAKEEEREAPMSLVTGRQAALEKQANIKLTGLQRELTRLTGNREGQLKAIETAYDIKRQNIQDAVSFYQLTAPDKLFVDENTGKVYFHNPATGEVYGEQMPGWKPSPDEFKYVDLGNRIAVMDESGREVRSLPKGKLPGDNGGGNVESWANLLEIGQATIANVPTNIRNSVVAYLRDKGIDINKPLSDTALTHINQTTFALSSLNDLRSVIQNNQEYIGPLSGLQKYNPYSEARQVQADIDRVRQTVGKALEGGVLRKEDEEKYKKILATITDTPTTALYKIDALISSITRDIENYKQLQSESGRYIPKEKPTETNELLVNGVFSPVAAQSKYNY